MLPETEEFYKKPADDSMPETEENIAQIIWLFLIKIRLYGRRYNAVYTNGRENILFFAKMFANNNWVRHYHQSTNL